MTLEGIHARIDNELADIDNAIQRIQARAQAEIQALQTRRQALMQAKSAVTVETVAVLEALQKVGIDLIR